MLKSGKWLILLLLIFGLVVGCGNSAEPEADGSGESADVDDESNADEEGADDDGAMADEAFTIGLIMVGPREDRGWNQAHWEGVEYAAEKMDAEIVWFDKLNIADNPDVTVEQVVDDLVGQGADFIVTNSAEFADPTDNAANAHPDVHFIHASGDNALNGSAPENVSNVMGQMEYGKMLAGCAAAMATEAGKIAYLGPLIDAETRRLVNSTYQGARYCYEQRGMNPDDLQFEVVWIGFWFNIPGVTLDPTQVVNDFIDGGADVIVSGIDTTEAIVVAGQRNSAGEAVFAVPYDYEGACDEAPDACLGVPFYNWGPDYLRLAEAARDGTWEQEWIWSGPDFSDLNNEDTSMIGWINGPALSQEGQDAIDAMVAGWESGDLDLWAGPLNYQDGSTFVADGETVDDNTLWYTEQLLQGVTGASE